MDQTAPLIQTMKTQLEVSTMVRPSCPATAGCRGTAPKTYQTKAVTPAQRAGALKSRSISESLMRILPKIS